MRNSPGNRYYLLAVRLDSTIVSRVNQSLLVCSLSPLYLLIFQHGPEKRPSTGQPYPILKAEATPHPQYTLLRNITAVPWFTSC